MTFRLEDQIFALIAPQTDVSGAKVVEQTLKERLIHTQTATPAAGRAITEPVYQFTIQVGQATFNEQGLSAKQLLSQAVEAMQQAPSITGEYPPETSSQ